MADGVPKGRLTEEGPLPSIYQVQEMPSEDYAARTEKNVLDSDGTLIISRGRPRAARIILAKWPLNMGSSCFISICPWGKEASEAGSLIGSWIEMNRIEVLNVAGPRASSDPSIYNDSANILTHALR